MILLAVGFIGRRNWFLSSMLLCGKLGTFMGSLENRDIFSELPKIIFIAFGNCCRFLFSGWVWKFPVWENASNVRVWDFRNFAYLQNNNNLLFSIRFDRLIWKSFIWLWNICPKKQSSAMAYPFLTLTATKSSFSHFRIPKICRCAPFKHYSILDRKLSLIQKLINQRDDPFNYERIIHHPTALLIPALTEHGFRVPQPTPTSTRSPINCPFQSKPSSPKSPARVIPANWNPFFFNLKWFIAAATFADNIVCSSEIIG